MDHDPFDLECFRQATFPVPPPGARKKQLPRHRPGEWFLLSVPWSWVWAAGQLPGKALLVGLALWREAGRRKGNPTVPFGLSQVVKMGLPLNTARRGLKALETAGLVSIVRKPGRKPEVTILEAPGGTDQQAASCSMPGSRVPSAAAPAVESASAIGTRRTPDSAVEGPRECTQ
jgi:hypothetical protein